MESKNKKTNSNTTISKASTVNGGSTIKTSAKKEQKLEKGEKYLPIGTVVLLKGGVKRVMITGFCVSRKEKPSEVWDYCGCPYPEGVFASENVLMFDHQQITEVFHIGLADEEEKDFKKRLEEEVNKLSEIQNSKNDNIEK